MSNVNWSADTLVDFLKRNCGKKDLTDADGEQIETINQDIILQFLNTGKRLIQNAVANAYKNTFAEFETVQITERVLKVAIPETAIYQRRIIRLDYAQNDNEDEYRTLHKAVNQRAAYIEGWPTEYYPVGNYVVIQPVPSSGFYRFLIQRRDDLLDVRRGIVASVTPSGDNLSTIELEDDDFQTASNKASLGRSEWICTCDYEGEVSMYNIPVQSYDEANRLITVRSGFAYDDEISEGDYVTIGKYTSTHSKLPDGFQDYFLTFAKYAIENDESNTDKIEQIPILQTIKSTILDGLAEDADEEPIPQQGQVDGDWFNEDT